MLQRQPRRQQFVRLAVLATLAAGPAGMAAAQVPSMQEGLNRVLQGLGARETVTLDNVAIDLGFATYRMPTITFAGVSLPRSDLQSLFAGGASQALASRLSRLSAKTVSIPELIVEQSVGPAKQVTRYRNLTAADVVDGRIASLTGESGSIEIKGGLDGDVSGTTGRLSVSDLDMVQTARIYAEPAAGQSAIAKLYSAFFIENLSLATTKGAQIKVARLSGRDFAARPTKESWVETMKLLGSIDTPDNVSPAEQSKLVAAFADLVDAMQIGSVEASGIEIADPTSKEQASGRIARIAYTGTADGNRPADLRMEGFEVGAKDGRARIGVVSFTGFSFAIAAELRALGDKPMNDLDIGALRKLIPTIGTIRVAGIDFDVPDKREKEPKPENIRFTVEDIEVTADRPVNGIPTNLRVGLNGFRLPIPPNTSEDGLKDILAMGYKELDLSWLMAAGWNEPASELVLRELSLRGAGMGSATLRGVFGEVTKDVFNPDSAIALVALLGGTVKNADLVVENGGLMERVIAQQARKQKKAPEELRREFGAAAAVAIPAMLGNSPAGKAIGQAVARFVVKPGRLSISAKTKAPAGLGVADFATLSEPAAILDRLEVTATAE
jgi:hypothetical protein